MNRHTRNNTESGSEDRGRWANKREYILVVAGNVVGLGNMWRFPYLCYKNGGGAFLVPYSILAVVCGIPLFLLETVIGQYTQEGMVTCWGKICPLAKGIGYGHLLIKLYDFIYIVIQAWALLYLIFSFQAELPWANCGNTWNTANCIDSQNWDSQSANRTENQTMVTNTTSAATEFWERRALAISGGIEELGSVRWDLALCLLFCWVFCYFSIWKGVRSSGKVVYFTATFPYVMLLILLIRGLTLPGAWEGIKYYLYPDIGHMADLEVWVEAGSQIMFSYSLATGTLIVLGSYNENNNNCYKDSFLLCLLNSGTSFVAGFVVFSILGFMAQKQGVPVDMVVDSGPGLAFVTYPQAMAMMPLPQFWSVCFFLMLILLSVDTQFVTVECFVTSLSDLFPRLLRPTGRREIFVLVVCLASFLIQLSLVTEGGIYVFQLIDYYGCNRACADIMALFECLAVGWIFGIDQFYNIAEDMTGQRPCYFFRLCWRYFVPLWSLSSFILYLVDYTQLQISTTYIYPGWAHALGWTMALSSILMVPLFGIRQVCLETGSLRQRLSVLCHPVEDPVQHKSKTVEIEMTEELMTSAP